MMFTPLALAAVLAVAPRPTAADVPVSFKGKSFTAKTLPAEMSAEQRGTVTRYTDWAAGAGYRMDFDAQGRVMLVTHKNRSGLSTSKTVVAKAQTWFDTVLPVPERKPADAPKTGAGPTRPASAPIPEDPESKLMQDTPQTAWGSGSVVPDSQVAALFIVKSAEDYASLLDVLAGKAPYLKEWLDHARKHTGFTIEEPLAGAYMENAAGQEEWNGDHELMNRTVQLLTLRRFGQQPNWIVQGIAWDSEITADGLVYCFPFRNEFVFAAEHGAWPNEVKLQLKGLDRALELGDFAKWKRGTYDGQAAKLAWGVTHHLLGQGPGRLSAALEDLRLARNESDRRSTGPDTWERIPSFELPADVQTQVLEARFGADVLKDATSSMRTGRVVKKDLKPPPK